MIKALSYLGFTSPEAQSWRSFGPDVLGLAVVEDEADEVVRLRMDEAAWRIEVRQADTNGLAFIGWDCGSADALSAAVAQLETAGVTVHSGDASLADARSVTAVAWFADPFGFRHELSHGQRVGDSPFVSPQGVSGFVTGENGLGHLVLMVPDLQAASDFFQGLLGFRHSDDIEQGIKVRFFHCNPRHHTLAVSEVPGHRGVHHFMIEARTVDDVGLAYDRAIAAGVPLAMTLGRHPNDMMTSFYVRTPLGCELEFGCGGRLMNMDEAESPGFYDAMSIWGHKPPEERLFPGILQPVD